MENKELKFKTNLNCGGCVSKVKTDLDQAEGISKWTVNTDSPEKTLTIESNGISNEEIIQLLKNKGFSAEVI